MVYKLDDADKLCGVTYIDWSKKYSPIPKATCETIKQQCSSGGGGSSDDALDLSCEEIKKLLKGEDKPKKDKPKEDTPNKEETPKENETPNEEGKEVNLLELMPRVEDKLSTVYIQARISSVVNPTNEEKEAFERKIIETLKSKLPEGAVVEAVLGEPYYKVGMEYSEEITNYKLNVRVRLNGKVYEHEYSVPNNIEYIGVTDYI